MSKLIKLVNSLTDYTSLKTRNNSDEIYKIATQDNTKVLPYQEIKAIEEKIIHLKISQINEKYNNSSNYSNEILNNLQNARNKQYKKEGLFRETTKLKKIAEEIYSDENISENIATHIDKLNSIELPQKYINDADTLRVINKYIKTKVNSSDFKQINNIISKYIKDIYSEKTLRENISLDKLPGNPSIKKPEIKTVNLAGRDKKRVSEEFKPSNNLETIISNNQKQLNTPENNEKEKEKTKKSYVPPIKKELSREEIIAQKPVAGGEKKETNETIAAKKRLEEYKARKAAYEQKNSPSNPSTKNIGNKQDQNLSKKKEAYSIKTELIKDKKKTSWEINKKLKQVNTYLSGQIDKSLKKLIPKIPSNYFSSKFEHILNYKPNLSKYKPQPLHITIPDSISNLKINRKGLLTIASIGILGTAGALYAFNQTNPVEHKKEKIKQKNQIENIVVNENIETKEKNSPFEITSDELTKQHKPTDKRKPLKNTSSNQNNKNNNYFRNAKTKNYFRNSSTSNHFRNSKIKNHFRNKRNN